MKNAGYEFVKERYVKNEYSLEKNKKNMQLIEDTKPQNRFIISSTSYWNMIKNDITFVCFIINMLVMPVICSEGDILTNDNFTKLSYFDYVFLADRIGDLFVSYVNTSGYPEPRLYKVLYHNMASPLYLEIFVTFSSFYFRYCTE